ncbi:hypothetical protein [Methanosarcina horonobensis]|nr:hypothetical protein [Methanosarcina horonobensis]
MITSSFQYMRKAYKNIHNWWLRVVDGAAGDEGSITEFYGLIG